MIGGLVATELLAAGLRGRARYGDDPGRVHRQRARRRRCGRWSTGRRSRRASRSCWWAHIAARRGVPRATCRSASTSTSRPRSPTSYFRKLAPRGELPAMDLEAEDATFGLRTLADLGWKDLLDGFTCTECGRCQEACPAWNTGKPLNPKTFIMGIRDMAVEAEHGLDLIPNSPIVRETYGLDDTLLPTRAGEADRRRRDPVRRRLGLRDLRRVRRGVPGRSSSTSTRSSACAATSCSRRSRFPQELTGAFRNMESAATRGASRRRPGSTGRRACRSRCRPWPRSLAAGRARRARGPVLGRLRGRVRRAQPARGARLGDVPRRRRRLVRGPRPGGVVHRRSGPPDGQRVRLPDPRGRRTSRRCNRYGMGERTIVTACPHCFNTIGNEYGQLGGRSRSSTTAEYLSELLAAGRLRTSAPTAGPASSVTSTTRAT